MEKEYKMIDSIILPTKKIVWPLVVLYSTIKMAVSSNREIVKKQKFLRIPCVLNCKEPVQSSDLCGERSGEKWRQYAQECTELLTKPQNTAV
jgi:hypothetical protein